MASMLQPVADFSDPSSRANKRPTFRQPGRPSMGAAISSRSWSTILLLVAQILITRICHHEANAIQQQQGDMDMSLDGPSLSLSLSSSSSTSPGSATSPSPLPSAGKTNSNSPSLAQQGYGDGMSNKITSDNYGDEFKLTESILEHVGTTMEQFAISEQMDQTKLPEGSLVSSWLLKLSGGRPLARNPLIEKLVSDLDYIYVSYYSQFRQLIQTIIHDRPPELTIQNLAFRCERHQELIALQQLASSSTIYRMILDTFFSELYSHCVGRKLATIRLSNVRPTSVVRQFVDIYLNVPTQHLISSAGASNEAALSDSEMKALREVQTGLALNFDLKRSLEMHGPMQMAAQLVFDPNSALAMNAAQMDTTSLINRFSRECQEHLGQLDQIWGQFDQVAAFLSSPMNNLNDFNGKIKTAAPQLMYGSICSQLLQTVQV